MKKWNFKVIPVATPSSISCLLMCFPEQEEEWGESQPLGPQRSRSTLNLICAMYTTTTTLRCLRYPSSLEIPALMIPLWTFQQHHSLGWQFPGAPAMCPVNSEPWRVPSRGSLSLFWLGCFIILALMFSGKDLNPVHHTLLSSVRSHISWPVSFPS